MKIFSFLNTVPNFSKIVALIVFFFSLIGSFLLGITYQKYISTSKLQVQIFQTPSPSPELTFEPKMQVLSTSYDQTKQIISRPRDDMEFDLVLKEGNNEKILDQVMNVKEIIWAPDYSGIAFSSGGASLGYTAEIINLTTGQKIPTQEQKELFKSLTGSYSHIYSKVLEWRENNQIMIAVGALGDTKQDKDVTQYYLIDALTGKVMKKLL